MPAEWTQKLEQLLKLKGSQAALAGELGISTRWLSELMQGRRAPAERIQRRIDSMLAEAATASIARQPTEPVSADQLYSAEEELWIVGDRPWNVVDLTSLIERRLCATEPAVPPLTVFFMSTLEGAARFAEELAWNLVSFDEAGQLVERKRFSGFAYIIVTNTLFFSPEILVVNPGSNCCSPTGSRSQEVFAMSSAGYVKLNTSAGGFINIARRLKLGASREKRNFFPVATKLTNDVLPFRNPFIDLPILGVRGNQPGEQTSKSEEADAMDASVGGVFERLEGREAQAKQFDSKCRFAPVFLSLYKRTIGDDIHDRPLAALSYEVTQTPKSTFW